MTRSQNRKNKHMCFKAEDELKQTLPSKETLIKLQEANEDIKKLVRGINTHDKFFKRGGLILRRWIPRNTDKEWCKSSPCTTAYHGRTVSKEKEK